MFLTHRGQVQPVPQQRRSIRRAPEASFHRQRHTARHSRRSTRRLTGTPSRSRAPPGCRSAAASVGARCDGSPGAGANPCTERGLCELPHTAPVPDRCGDALMSVHFQRFARCGQLSRGVDCLLPLCRHSQRLTWHVRRPVKVWRMKTYIGFISSPLLEEGEVRLGIAVVLAPSVTARRRRK